MKKLLFPVDILVRLLILRVLFAIWTPERILHFCQAWPAIRQNNLTAAEFESLYKWAIRFSTRMSKNSCLLHSTALFWVDPQSRIHIGIKTDGSMAEAHAWIERDGRSYSSVPKENYNELIRLGGPA